LISISIIGEVKDSKAIDEVLSFWNTYQGEYKQGNLRFQWLSFWNTYQG
jgi:hypothetical protein